MLKRIRDIEESAQKCTRKTTNKVLQPADKRHFAHSTVTNLVGRQFIRSDELMNIQSMDRSLGDL